MITVYKLSKKLKLRFTTPQFILLGRQIAAKHHELFPGQKLTKIKVNLKTRKGEPFYWFVIQYEEAFIPEMTTLMVESARLIAEKASKKKRPRLQKPHFTAKPE